MPSDSNSPLLTYLVNHEPAFRKARLGALYSDFRALQSINPDGYTANIESWCGGLAHASRAGVASPSLLTIQLDEPFFRSLETAQWGRPLGLGVVVAESIRRKEMMGLKEFMGEKESIYTKRWDLSPWSLMGWGLRSLGLIGQPGDKVSKDKLVVIANLEDAAKAFVSRTKDTRGRVDRVYSRRMFEEEFADLLGDKELSAADFEVLLRFLERDKQLLLYDKETVKLRAAGEGNMITQEDSTIASLQVLIIDLTAQIEVLETRVEASNKSAREAVAKKNKISALGALRSKKLAEATLSKRHAVLAQLDQLYAKIEQASGQVELVRVMEGSTQVLAGLNKQVGGVERVDDVLERLREQMGEVNEVGEVLAEQGREGVDETEVDEELEAMERAEREQREAIEREAREKEKEKEADETARKLAELEKVEKVARERAEAEKAKEADEVEVELKKSIENLRKMSLGKPETEPERLDAQPEQPDAQPA